MRRLGSAWRLGALLLDREGRPWRTGLSTRVAEPGRPQHLSSSAEERRALRAAALRGGFAMGETVNHGVAPIAVDGSLVGGDGPLRIVGGEARVHWGTDAPVPLERYLDDLGDLLLHPPQGA
ncbi:glutaminase [Agrococcus sp. SL85]|uniref:glutaminase n=1 Tax=Agrococcus sp. SL85 TaxID=2995141 RepID=UPI00226CBBC7|nr:glutaminase [Agrococcus sp. SL85]WAC65972.1 glutaminase [Agrococcus sp. SL85]